MNTGSTRTQFEPPRIHIWWYSPLKVAHAPQATLPRHTATSTIATASIRRLSLTHDAPTDLQQQQPKEIYD